MPQLDPAPNRPSASHRVRFELILASVLLALGLFVVPAAVYWVGVTELGPYEAGASLGTFYTDFFGDLASVVGRAWVLALGPLILISLLRLVFVRRPAADAEDAAPRQAPPPTPASARRKEPSVNLD